MPPGRHRPHEHPGVSSKLAKPYAIPKNRPTRIRTRRIDSHNPYTPPLPAQGPGQPIYERALPRASRTGDPHSKCPHPALQRLAAMPKEFSSLRRTILHQGNGSRQRPSLAGTQPCKQLRHGGRAILHFV